MSDDEVQLSTAQDAVAYVESLNTVGVDLETTGLDFVTDELTMLIVGDDVNQYVIDARTEDLSPFKPMLENKEIVKLGHNLSFDYKFLRKRGIMMERIHDTMRAEYVLNAGNQLTFTSLAFLVDKYCNKSLEKSTRDEFITVGSLPFTISQIIYGARDIEYLPAIYSVQIKEARKLQLHYTMAMECNSYLAIADMEYNGLKLHHDDWLALEQEAKGDAAALRTELDEVIVNDPIFQDLRVKYLQTNLFVPDEDLPQVDISWDSPKQVLEVMRKIEPSLTGVAMDALKPFIDNHAVIETYSRYKEFGKRVSTYGSTFFKYESQDGLIHSNYNTVETGRLSSANPNLQNIPADNRYRNCFQPPVDKYVFVSADYSSQELALIAHDSNDAVWLNALENKYDLHSVCAELIFGEAWATAALSDCAYFETIETVSEPDENNKRLTLSYTRKQKCTCPRHKVLRHSVKSINFGLAYGMSEHKLAKVLNISENEAKQLIEKYFSTFPNIKASLERSAQFAKQHGYIRTMYPYGRIRWFPEWAGADYSQIGRIERQGKNSHIQGSGSDMTKEALVRVRRYIIDNNLPVLIVNSVHDQIDTVCPATIQDDWSNKLIQLMEEAAKSIIPTGLLKAESTISLRWKK